MGHLQRGVADLAGLLAEDGPQQALLGGQLRLPLGRDLAHQHIAGAHLGADPDDAPFVEIFQDVVGEVGDVAGDLLSAQLGVAGVDLVLVDVDRGEHVVADEPIRQDDGVLEVVALPGHEGNEQVLAQGQFAVHRGRSVGQDLALLEPVTPAHQGPLADAGVLVGPLELLEPQILAAGFGVLDHHAVAVELDYPAVLGGDDHVGRVPGGPGLNAGADVGGLGPQQGHGLALHVGPHQGPVGVVVLEERDQGGGHRDDLLGRDVHQLDLVGGYVGDLGGGPEEHLLLELQAQIPDRGGLGRPSDQHPGVDEATLGVDGGVGLGDYVLLLLVGGEVHDLVGDPAVGDHPIGRLDEAERVDPGVGGQTADQPDVGALGGLDRAHPPVVGEVDVAHLETGPLPTQAAGTEG